MSTTPQEHHIPITRTARYFTLGTPGRQIRQLWYVLHGYGQLAHYFIQHFTPIADTETLIIAPEGLSLFYLPPGWNRVGATWMTKEKRISEIQDYIRFLDQVHQAILPTVPHDCQINLLGFSQGATTAWRWMRETQLNPHHFINWAGSLPEDGTTASAYRPADTHLHYISATQDEFVTPEAALKVTQLMAPLGRSLHTYTFDGSHRMDEPTLLQLNQNILTL